ncbi:MAG TPA: ABC transporter [Microbacteriaceae bacterium]|nr:ABC transporter [Microbacteriaceae bacterium]
MTVQSKTVDSAAVPARIAEGDNDIAGLSPVVEYVDVTKVFGTTVAAKDVSLGLNQGSVLALVGENGAGKSTLVKTLGGVYRPDGGHLLVMGERVAFASPLDAQRAGVSVVHQHPGLFPDLSLAENVFAGKPLRTKAGLLDHRSMRSEAAQILASLGLYVPVTQPVSSLRTSEQQLVEIGRALASKAKVIILDEPTAALTTVEVDRLFSVIRRLRDSGVALMFVGHRLEEIFAISDRIAILRDGALVETRRTVETTQDQAVRLMVGRELDAIYPEKTATIGPTVLTVNDLGDGRDFHHATFSVRAGEVVGLAGLVGSGRTEIARVLFGITKARAGVVELDGTRVRFASPADAMAHGVAYVSEDRRGQSIVEEFSILDNATLPVIGEATRFGLIRRRLELALVEGPLQRMQLKFASYLQPISTLSGGNQQKVVLAKWLAANPRGLILDEPTQGIDIHAKSEVHRIIAELSSQGLAILLISSDMPELLGMCDTIHVMRQGEFVATFDRENVTQYEIAKAATGATDQNEPTAGAPLVAPELPDEAKAADVIKQDVIKQDRYKDGLGAGRRSALLQRVKSLVVRRELGLVVALLVIVLPLGAVNSHVYDAGNVLDLVTTSAMLGIVVLGQMLVMLTRNIDLSVGSTIGLTAFLSTGFMKYNPHAPILLGIAVAVGIGVVCGLINGLIVAYGGVPSIVVTLGTLAIYRGIDSVVASGVQFSTNDVPPAWVRWATHETFGASTIIWIAVIIFVALAFVLLRTEIGREIFATGSNPAGAELIGIRAQRRVLLAFVASGTFAGLYGALTASRLGQVDVGIGLGLELTVIASAVVGGVALRGGSGTVIGVALGTFALYVIQNVLALAQVPSQDLQAVYGAAILLTVAIDVVISKRSSTRKGAIA